MSQEESPRQEIEMNDATLNSQQHEPMPVPLAHFHHAVHDPVAQTTDAEAHPETTQMLLQALNASLHEPPIDFDPNDSVSMLSAIKQLQHTQRHQSQMILAMSQHLSANEAKMDSCSAKSQNIAASRAPRPVSHRTNAKYQTELITAQLQSLDNEVECTTTDEEIDSIIHQKKVDQQWPVHRLKKWIEEQDLQKIRLHRSLKHNHVPIRIPRNDKNKEGRLICKLCSGGKCNRNTTWMCTVCEVPLCIDRVDGDSSLTHHILWHRALDLEVEHEKCNALLKERRLEKKRGLDKIAVNGGKIKRERLDLMDGMMVPETGVVHESMHAINHGDAIHHDEGVHNEGDLHGNEVHLREMNENEVQL